MKKVIVALLLAFFAVQGVAFAEDVQADVQATAESANAVVEDTVVAEDIVTPEGEEVLVEETEEALPADAAAAL